MSIVQAHLACSIIFFARRYRKQPIFHRLLWFALKMDRFPLRFGSESQMEIRLVSANRLKRLF